METDQSIVSPANYQLPATPPRPRKNWVLVLVGVIIALLVIGAAAVAAFYYYPPAVALKSALLLPQELKGATFLAEGPDGTVAYRLEGLSYKPTPIPGTLISATPMRDTELLRDAEGTYRVIAGGNEIFATSTPLAGIASSDDHAVLVTAAPMKAGTQLFEQASQLPVLAIDTTAWHILYRRVLASGAIEATGPKGVAPLLLADSTVLYLSPAGISAWNINTSAVSLLLPRTLHSTAISVLQSPDGSKIGIRDSAEKTITVYAVTATSAEVAGTIALTDPVASYALGNDALYSVRRSSIGSEIWKQGFAEEEAHRIGFLPKGLNITRLLIGSL